MSRQKLFPEALSESELMIMKLIWDSEEELVLHQLVELVNEKYGRNWSSNIISTFLSRMVSKGYIVSYKKGRCYYYHVVVTESAYKVRFVEHQIKIWNDGSAGDYISDIIQNIELSKEDIQKIEAAVKQRGTGI